MPSDSQLPPVIVTQPKQAPKPKAVAAKKSKAEPGSEVPAPATPAKAAPAPAAAAPVAPAAAAAAPSPLAGTTVVSGESFAPVTTVPGAEFTATHGDTITDTLQNLPGVAGTTFAPGADRPILRGLDGNRVRVQEGGIAVGDVSDLSEDHAIPVDPCSVEKVDVIRGPASLRYTNKAVGGVVDAETNRIPTAVPANGFSGEVRGGFHSRR